MGPRLPQCFSDVTQLLNGRFNLAFGTSVAVLVLEIPYRYLPIFQR